MCIRSLWLPFLLALLVVYHSAAAEAELPAKPAADHQALAAQAQLAYQAKDYPRAAELFRQAIAQADGADDRYNLACCLALAGDADHALEELGQAVGKGFSDADHLLKDEDLARLREDARFKDLVARARVLQDRERERMAKFALLPPAPEVFALPVDEPGDRRFPLVVGLHGVGDNPGHFFAAFKGWARQSGFALLAISGSRALSDAGNAYRWMMPGDVERVHRIVLSTLERQPIDRTRIYVLGFSQGGVMVYPIAFRDPDLFAGVISMSGSLQPETVSDQLLAAAAAKLPVVIIHGEQDPNMPFSLGRSAEDRLRAAHFDVTLVPFTGGHRFPPHHEQELSRAVAWIDEHRHR